MPWCGPSSDAESWVHSIRKRELAHRESSNDPHERAGFEIELQLRHMVIEGRKSTGRHLATDPSRFDRDTAVRRQ
jgi:hypothetical protein